MMLLNDQKLKVYVNKLLNYQITINDIPEEYRTNQICDIYIKRFINSDRFNINLIPVTYNGRYSKFIKRRMLEKYSDDLITYKTKFEDIPEEYRSDEICDIYIFLCMKGFEQKYGKWKASNCERWGYDGYETFLKDKDIDFNMSLIPLTYSGKYSKFIVYVDGIGSLAYKDNIRYSSKWNVEKAYMAEPEYFHDEISSHDYFKTSKDTFDIGIVPKEYRTEEMCEFYFNQVGKNIDLNLIPKIYITKKMVDAYLDRAKDNLDLSLIPQEFITKKMVDKYVAKNPNGFDLSVIPEIYRTNKLCRKYIRSFRMYKNLYEGLMMDLANGKKVPDNFREFRVDAIPVTYKGDGKDIVDIYLEYANMAPNTFKIDYISPDYALQFLWKLYGNGKPLDDFDLSLIPIKHRVKAVCDYYVSINENSFDIRLIPIECRSINICKKYINNNINDFNLGLIPESNRTKWMVEKYVNNIDNFNLAYIPEELRSLDICNKYLENNPKNYDISLIPDKFINPLFIRAMYEDAVKYRDIIQRDVTMRAFRTLIRANPKNRVDGYAWIMKRYIRNKILNGNYEIAHTLPEEMEEIEKCTSLKLASSPKTLLTTHEVSFNETFVRNFQKFIDVLGKILELDDKKEKAFNENQRNMALMDKQINVINDINTANYELKFSDSHEKLVEDLESKFDL